MLKQSDTKATPAMVKAAEALLVLKAIENTIRPIVVGYQRKILASKQWPMDAEHTGSDRWSYPVGTMITDPSMTYLLPTELHAEYVKRCNDEREAAGLKVSSPEYCPLLVAQNMVRKAERVLVDTVAAGIPVAKDLTSEAVLMIGLDNYRRLVDLHLSWLSPMVRPSKELLAAYAGGVAA